MSYRYNVKSFFFKIFKDKGIFYKKQDSTINIVEISIVLP